MSNGLGRGLSSLIPPKQNAFSVDAEVEASDPDLKLASETTIQHLPVDQIEPNPLQPRQHFDEKNLDELAESIRVYGLLEPVVVTPVDNKWQLVAGERRLRAFKKLKKSTIPAIARTTDELERLELALIENIQRQDLNPIERAQGLATLVDDFGLTQQEAAKKIGIARSSLANSIRLLDLPTEMQKALAGRQISEGHAKILLGVEDEKEQQALFKQLLQGPSMSVRDLSDVAEKKKGKKRSTTTKDAVTNREAQDKLQSVLGTKVTVKSKKSGGKQVVIDTYSKEEFSSLFKKLAKK